MEYENVDTRILQTIISNYKKQNCQTVYAIRDLATGLIIWNARGSTYKNKIDVVKKIKKLCDQNKTDLSRYKMLTYRLVDKDIK